MQREQHDVIFFTELQQGRPEHWPSGQVEGASALFNRQASCLFFFFVAFKMIPVDYRKPYSLGRRDALVGLAFYRFKPRSQYLVPSDNLAEAAFQRLEVHLPEEPHRRRQIVKRITGTQAVKEPEPLLRERERQVYVSRHALHFRRSHLFGCL